MKQLISFLFAACTLEEISDLRILKVQDYKAQIQAYIEEGIITYKAACIKIMDDNKCIGYLCIGTYLDYKNAILEFYLHGDYRNYAKQILEELKKQYPYTGWYINTQDSFALSLLFDLNLPYKTTGYIFALSKKIQPVDLKAEGTTFTVTRKEEIDEVYKLAMEDNFYTGEGKDSLYMYLKKGTFYSLRKKEKLIGLGYLDILERTPDFADIGMIVEREFRQKGWGKYILSYLINECILHKCIPTTCCDAQNFLSRKTIHSTGFYLDGCMLLADV